MATNHPSILCTVDLVLLTLKQDRLHVAVFQREKEPFAGAWALPGGYVHAQEDYDTRSAALRVLREKTSVDSAFLEQLATFSGPGRDPRGWSISVAYYALVPLEKLAALEGPGMRLVAVEDASAVKAMPFDHAAIVQAAVQRVRDKSSYSSLPVFLLPEHFTLPQLQAVYETLLGEPLNKVSFRRKMQELDMLEEVPGEQVGGRHRPAQVYAVRKEFAERLSLSSRAFNPD